MIRLFRVFVPTAVVGLILAEILLTAACYVLAFALLSADLFEMYYFYEGGVQQTAIVVVGIIVGIYFNDLYSDLRVSSRIRLVQQYCLVIGIAFIFQALLSYADPALILGRWQMIAGSVFALVVLPAWRIAYSRVVVGRLGRQTLLFLGDNATIREIGRRIAARPEFGLQSVGYLSEEPEPAGAGDLGPRMGGLDDLVAQVERLRPDLVVVGLRERRGRLPVLPLLGLRQAGARIEEAASVYEAVMHRVSLEALKPADLVFSNVLGSDQRYLLLSRLGGFSLALALALLTAPLMLIVALAIRLSSPGPVFYVQERVGLRGRRFRLYKFRSMRADAEQKTGAVWAAADDPRITPVGRWLRRFRIDELPQLLNVLRGEMAIVGPRPERPEFVQVLSREIPFYGHRHAIPPGITGWAQISHGYGDSIQDAVTKLEFDLYYLKNLSLSLDTYIVFHTLKVMLLRRGAQ